MHVFDVFVSSLLWLRLMVSFFFNHLIYISQEQLLPH